MQLGHHHQIDSYLHTADRLMSFCDWPVLGPPRSLNKMIGQAVKTSCCPRCKSLLSYVTSVCLCSQGAVWHWRHWETDSRAVRPGPPSDQSEANERPGSSAESFPRDGPSIWQTKRQTGESLKVLISKKDNYILILFIYLYLMCRLAWWYRADASVTMRLNAWMRTRGPSKLAHIDCSHSATFVTECHF